MYIGDGPPSLLEQILNERFESPNGKPFRVIGGALGAWALAQQYIYASLYGANVDAIIELDGYNEAVNVTFGQPLDKPNTIMYMMAAQPGWATSNIHRILFLQRLRRFIYNSPRLKNSFFAFFVWRKLIPRNPGSTTGTPLKVVEDSFVLPNSWTFEKKNRWNRNRYKNYIRLMASLSNTLGLRYAQFLQPMFSIDKPMSEEEKRIPRLVSPEVYRDVFVNALQELQVEGLPTTSLTSIFKKTFAPIYVDQVHCNAHGYEILSAQISEDVGALRRLKKRH
jgi:hypothetical protein